MKYRLLTPGPTPVPEETLLEMAKPVPYHRTPEARQALKEVLEGLQYVFQTSNDIIPLTCSGTGALEAALVCSVPRGAKAICVYAGRFGERWHKLWKAFGVESIPVTAPWGEAVSPEHLAGALKDHPDAVAVCVVHSETSTGVKHDLAAFGALVAKTPAILIVDAISSAGALELRTDAWQIDMVGTGSQKALMMPPGLGFVSVSPKAWQRIEIHQAPAFYFDLKKYRAKLVDPDTPFTPAHTLIRGLQVSLSRMRTEGIENIWARCARMAKAAQAGAKAMNLELFAHPPAEGLTSIKVPSGIDGVALLKKLEKQHGLKIAGGQDQLKGKIVRLAHMGYIDFFDVLAGAGPMGRAEQPLWWADLQHYIPADVLFAWIRAVRLQSVLHVPAVHIPSVLWILQPILLLVSVPALSALHLHPLLLLLLTRAPTPRGESSSPVVEAGDYQAVYSEAAPCFTAPAVGPDFFGVVVGLMS